MAKEIEKFNELESLSALVSLENWIIYKEPHQGLFAFNSSSNVKLRLYIRAVNEWSSRYGLANYIRKSILLWEKENN